MAYNYCFDFKIYWRSFNLIDMGMGVTIKPPIFQIRTVQISMHPQRMSDENTIEFQILEFRISILSGFIYFFFFTFRAFTGSPINYVRIICLCNSSKESLARRYQIKSNKPYVYIVFGFD